MTRVEHLLSIVAEECAEIAQRCSKALRFGLREVQPGQDLSNAQRIALEYKDLVSAMILLSREEPLIMPDISPATLEIKRQKIEEFLLYSETCGTLK
jgi:hypothetical protein